MDSCCATLKANAYPVKLGGGLNNGGTRFWGESIRGSPKSRDLSTQLLKSSKKETSRITKLKPGVAYSVLTSDINKQNLVSDFIWVFIYLFRMCLFTLTVTLTFLFQSFHEPLFETPKADPKNVASIILGGGAGTRLFPLTSRRAKPAVWYQLFLLKLDSMALVINNRMTFVQYWDTNY